MITVATRFSVGYTMVIPIMRKEPITFIMPSGGTAVLPSIDALLELEDALVERQGRRARRDAHQATRDANGATVSPIVNTAPDAAWTMFCGLLAGDKRKPQRKLLAVVRAKKKCTLDELMPLFDTKKGQAVGGRISGVSKNADKAGFPKNAVLILNKVERTVSAGPALLANDPPAP